MIVIFLSRNRHSRESGEGGQADGGGERHQVRRSRKKIGNGKLIDLQLNVITSTITE
jgi:hypothetical protein